MESAMDAQDTPRSVKWLTLLLAAVEADALTYALLLNTKEIEMAVLEFDRFEDHDQSVQAQWEAWQAASLYGRCRALLGGQ